VNDCVLIFDEFFGQHFAPPKRQIGKGKTTKTEMTFAGAYSRMCNQIADFPILTTLC
jgi:hypothetical protein